MKGADAKRLSHRVGSVAGISSLSELTNKAGRVWRFTHAQVAWETAGPPQRIDLTGDYKVGDRTAVIWRGDAQICDVNLRTGKLSTIGDRTEGIAAIIMVAALPLNIVLIGLPLYYGVALWSRISANRLRKRVGAYVAQHIAPLVA